MDNSAQAIRDAVLRRYAEGERKFNSEELDLGCLDFRDADLAGADFSEAFIHADFVGANLSGCNFDRAHVKCCDFRGANLLGASFIGAAIDGADFDQSGIEAADFEGANEQGYVFKAGEKPVRRQGASHPASAP